ncbi:hypothetical protein D3C81_982970 [compost metagenome]
MRRRVARRDDGDAQDLLVAGIAPLRFFFQALHGGQLLEQVGQRAGTVRRAHVQGFMGVEFVDVIVALENGFRLVIGDHAIEVEGHAQFLVALVVFRARRQHQAGRILAGQRTAHIVFIRAEEQRRIEGGQVGVGRLARHEGGARDVQAVVGDRVHDAQARFRRIARKQHHFHGRLARIVFVDVQEAADEREGHAARQHLGYMRFLVLAVFLRAAVEVDLVRFRQVEQRARSDADHQFVFDRISHGVPVVCLLTILYDY